MKKFLICVITIASFSSGLFGQSDNLLDSVKLLVMQEYVDSSITFVQNGFRMQGIDLCEDKIKEIESIYGKDSLWSLYLDLYDRFIEVEYSTENISTEYVAYISEVHNGFLAVIIYPVDLLNEIGITWASAQQYTFNLDSLGNIEGYCVVRIEH